MMGTRALVTEEGVEGNRRNRRHSSKLCLSLLDAMYKFTNFHG
jgi:hypothetical protein